MQLYSIRYHYSIFATQEKRSATALEDAEQRWSPAGDHLLTTCCGEPHLTQGSLAETLSLG
jgi:hypothetical protein